MDKQSSELSMVEWLAATATRDAPPPAARRSWESSSLEQPPEPVLPERSAVPEQSSPPERSSPPAPSLPAASPPAAPPLGESAPPAAALPEPSSSPAAPVVADPPSELSMVEWLIGTGDWIETQATTLLPVLRPPLPSYAIEDPPAPSRVVPSSPRRRPVPVAKQPTAATAVRPADDLASAPAEQRPRRVPRSHRKRRRYDRVAVLAVIVGLLALGLSVLPGAGFVSAVVGCLAFGLAVAALVRIRRGMASNVRTAAAGVLTAVTAVALGGVKASDAAPLPAPTAAASHAVSAAAPTPAPAPARFGEVSGQPGGWGVEIGQPRPTATTTPMPAAKPAAATRVVRMKATLANRTGAPQSARSLAIRATANGAPAPTVVDSDQSDPSDVVDSGDSKSVGIAVRVPVGPVELRVEALGSNGLAAVFLGAV